MTLQFLEKRRRQRATKVVKSIHPGLIKDSLITQIQPWFAEDIVDIDLPDIKNLTIYLKKGAKSKTEKD